MTESSPEPKPCDLAVFVAHPDDAELTCGGTLALAAEQGWRTAVVDYTRGELSTRGTPENRAREAAAASRVLALESRVQLGFADGGLHDDDEHRGRTVDTLRQLRPRVVIAPPLQDHHADHMAVARIVSRAFYLAGVGKYRPEHPPWRPHALLHYVGTRPEVPDLVVDISSVIERRRQAVSCYRSQLHDPGSSEPATRIARPEFEEWIEGRLRHFGFLIGARHGEAFTSPEPIAVLDIVRLLGEPRWPARTNES